MGGGDGLGDGKRLGVRRLWFKVNEAHTRGTVFPPDGKFKKRGSTQEEKDEASWRLPTWQAALGLVLQGPGRGKVAWPRLRQGRGSCLLLARSWLCSWWREGVAEWPGGHADLQGCAGSRPLCF